MKLQKNVKFDLNLTRDTIIKHISDAEEYQPFYVVNWIKRETDVHIKTYLTDVENKKTYVL